MVNKIRLKLRVKFQKKGLGRDKEDECFIKFLKKNPSKHCLNPKEDTK